MALTTHKNVWKILILAFAVLSAIFAVFFYFKTISITFVVGLSLIIITQRLKEDYITRMKRYGYSRIKMKIYGIGLIIFWIIVGGFIIITSLNDVTELLISISGNPQITTAKYLEFGERYIPEAIFTQFMTGENIILAQRWALEFITSILSQLTAFVINGALIIPLMFYMYFTRRKTLWKRLISAVPDGYRKMFLRASHKVGDRLNFFLSAKVIESTVIGAICCFGFFVAGLKGWLILGIIAGFLNIVPYLGPILGAIPPLLIAILDEPIVVIYVIITVTIAQLIDNFYLIPFMISSKVRVEPLVSIFLILAGAQLFGVVGMIFAIPVYLIYKIVLFELYDELITHYR